MKIRQVTGLRARVRVLAVAALVVLSACSTGPNRQQHQPGAATPEAFDEPTRGRLSAAQPVVEWWQPLPSIPAQINAGNPLVKRRPDLRRAHLLEAAVASAKAAAYARERFDSGIDSFLDVLDAERTLLEAQGRLAQSETETVARLIDVYRALGGGWQGRS